MPIEGVIWVDGMASVRIDGDGVLLEFLTGGRKLCIRLSRANFRACVEHGQRILAEADRKGADAVVQFKARK